MNRQEEILQSQCTVWFNNNHLQYHKCLFAITNNSVNKIGGALATAKGVKSGVSDLCLICPNGKTLWIEMKTPTGTQDKEQIIFQKQIEALNHTYVICRSLQQFQELILSHFKDV